MPFTLMLKLVPRPGSVPGAVCDHTAMLTGTRVKAPPDLLDTYPELKKFADPDHEAADGNLSLLA